MLKEAKYLIVGAGCFGAVLAERIANAAGLPVAVVDRRSEPGGNSASFLEPETGIECHRFGSHIFHTSSEKVWRYVRRFADFTSYRHHVAIRTNGLTCFMPLNLKTLCDFYGESLSPSEAERRIADDAAACGIRNPASLEETALAQIGEPLYRCFFAGYTEKQWGRDPKELPADIIRRLPVRTNFNTDYFDDPRQGVPVRGYADLFRSLLNSPRIRLLLRTDFRSVRNELAPDCRILYTGMIDEFFDRCLGPLEWRSLRFEWETLPVRDFQGISVMNYGDPEIPYTRIHEFKHYHPERKEIFASGRTVICREYPLAWKPGEEAFYPVNDAANQRLFARYQALAAETAPNVIFGGRLGSYRYWNMDQAIAAALDCFERLFPHSAAAGL